MNIQQLNGNGQSVWVFVITAVIALLITAGTWYLSEATNTYRRWHRIRAEPVASSFAHNGIKQPEFSIAERIAMVVWLRRSGYAYWMKTTGAWWKILLNRSDPIMVNPWSPNRWQTSAGDLVSRYSSGELKYHLVLNHCTVVAPPKLEETASPISVP